MASKRELSNNLEVRPYDHPSGGWGSVRSLARSLTRDRVPFPRSTCAAKAEQA